MNEQNKQLCLSLLHADSEQEVIETLKNAGYWNDETSWRDYGDKENNFSIIGNQQSSADGALVEKLINSIDAVLIRECRRRGLDPQSLEAPRSMNDALHEYFGIYKGKLSNIDARVRSQLADQISLIATGEKTNPSYTIIDRGEGQTPDAMPDSFLSLSESNKLRIPFVQGKFNMGSTGVLQFCGQQNLQLIITRRDPHIADRKNDASADLWGFTVVRRDYPKSGMRSSVFRYLAPQGNVLRFKAEHIAALPGDYPQAYARELAFGSVIKLYEYQLKGRLKTQIKFNLYYRLALLMPGLALPILMYERRPGYTADVYQVILSGLGVRLDEDKRQNLEPGFPSSGEIRINGEKMKLQIYAFKAGKATNYAEKEGVIFSVNGQAHGFMYRGFFDKRTVGMQYLRDDILVLADCSEFSGELRENLFMNSRDRLRDGVTKEAIEEQLESIIRTHEGLHALRERRKREDIEHMLQDAKPMVDILNKIITKSPSLSRLFMQGLTVKNPFNFTTVKTQPEYHGKTYPTYFSLKKGYSEEQPKLCHSNRNFRVSFETDVENDYFTRDTDPGEYTITCKELPEKAYSHNLNLWNGIGTLTVDLPEKIKEGDTFHFTMSVTDRTLIEPFSNDFFVRIIQPDLHTDRNTGTRTQPPSDEPGDERNKPSGLSLPDIRESRKSQDDEYKFREDEQGALIVKDLGEEGYRFFVNMDNPYLKTEMKGTSIDPKLLESQFKFGMALLGISILNEYEKIEKEEVDEDSDSKYEKISFFTKSVAPVLLPIITNLGNLEVE